MSTAENERQSLESQVVEKALTDDDFRQQLVSDPKGAIEKEYNVQLPADLKIDVVQEEKAHLYLVLPFAALAGQELSSGDVGGADDCSGWSSAAECAVECTQCGNNDTTCAPGPTEEE